MKKTMSLAWEKINSIILLLSGPGSQRQRLCSADIQTLLDLKHKDLPIEIRPTFDRLSLQVSHSNRSASRKELNATIDAMADRELAKIIADVIHMHNILTGYQPVMSNAEHEQVSRLYRDCSAI